MYYLVTWNLDASQDGKVRVGHWEAQRCRKWDSELYQCSEQRKLLGGGHTEWNRESVFGHLPVACTWAQVSRLGP